MGRTKMIFEESIKWCESCMCLIYLCVYVSVCVYMPAVATHNSWFGLKLEAFGAARLTARLHGGGRRSAVFGHVRSTSSAASKDTTLVRCEKIHALVLNKYLTNMYGFAESTAKDECFLPKIFAHFFYDVISCEFVHTFFYMIHILLFVIIFHIFHMVVYISAYPVTSIWYIIFEKCCFSHF